MLMAEEKFKKAGKESLIKGISAIAGAIAGYFADKYIPSFPYRNVIVGIVGVALVFSGAYVTAEINEVAGYFLVGMGAIMTVELMSVIPSKSVELTIGE